MIILHSIFRVNSSLHHNIIRQKYVTMLLDSNTNTSNFVWQDPLGVKRSDPPSYLPGSGRLWDQVHNIVKPWLNDAFRNFGVPGWYEEKKTMRRSRVSKSSGLRDKTRNELGITWYTIAGDSKTGGDWRYCKPYVHITKFLAGTKTCTDQDCMYDI